MVHYCQTQVPKLVTFTTSLVAKLLLPSMVTKMVTAGSAVMTV